MNNTIDITIGSRNLLQECLGSKPGDRLIILHEDPALNFYDDKAPQTLFEVATADGLIADIRQVGFSPDCNHVDDTLWDFVKTFDHAVFFARLGDQYRLAGKSAANTNVVIMYTLDQSMLASRYASLSYCGMGKIKVLVDKTLMQARHIKISCQYGTDISGNFSPKLTENLKPTGFGIAEFPIPVARAIEADPFEGTITLRHNIAGSGNRYFDPWGISFEGTLTAELRNGVISNLLGPKNSVDKVTTYVENVGKTFDFNPWIAQSWHAGIHPGCAYAMRPDDNLERWVTGPFANPRAFHFHCGGHKPPGEINWHIIDVTIEVDGIALWENGQFHPERLTGGAEILNHYPEIVSAFANPAREIGLH